MFFIFYMQHPPPPHHNPHTHFLSNYRIYFCLILPDLWLKFPDFGANFVERLAICVGFLSLVSGLLTNFVEMLAYFSGYFSQAVVYRVSSRIVSILTLKTILEFQISIRLFCLISVLVLSNQVSRFST